MTSSLKLGLTVGYSGPQIPDQIPLAKLADELGFDSIWTAEAYGSDAITPLAWMGAHTKSVKLGTAIMQIAGRTPTMTAMTAASLDQLSGGRFICGIGVSGPQVVEGWLGMPYGRPLVKTREFVEILRKCFAREEPVVHEGVHFQIPLQGGTGLGKPLKMILHPRRSIPIVIAAIGPKNVQLAAEIAEGVIPAFFSPYRDEVFQKPIEEGFTKRTLSKDAFEVIAACPVAMTEDLREGLDSMKPRLALYLGGMGAKGKNFYFDLACRYGYEDVAHKIQDAFLDGRKLEAISLVPDELADETSLIGPIERITDRLGAWRDSIATTILVSAKDPATLEALAKAI